MGSLPIYERSESTFLNRELSAPPHSQRGCQCYLHMLETPRLPRPLSYEREREREREKGCYIHCLRKDREQPPPALEQWCDVYTSWKRYTLSLDLLEEMMQDPLPPSEKVVV